MSLSCLQVKGNQGFSNAAYGDIKLQPTAADPCTNPPLHEIYVIVCCKGGFVFATHKGNLGSLYFPIKLMYFNTKN